MTKKRNREATANTKPTKSLPRNTSPLPPKRKPTVWLNTGRSTRHHRRSLLPKPRRRPRSRRLSRNWRLNSSMRWRRTLRQRIRRGVYWVCFLVQRGAWVFFRGLLLLLLRCMGSGALHGWSFDVGRERWDSRQYIGCGGPWGRWQKQAWSVTLWFSFT